MQGEAFDVHHLYPLDFMQQVPVYGGSGGGGAPLRFIVNSNGFIAGIVIFSSSTIASIIPGYYVEWDDTTKSADDLYQELYDGIEAAIDEFMNTASSNTPRPTYFIGFIDDRHSVKVTSSGGIASKFTFGRRSDIIRSQTDSSLVDDGTVVEIKTEECQYYAAINGWGEEGETGGGDQA